MIRITTLLRAYRVKHLRVYREELIKGLSPNLKDGKLKDANARIERAVEEKDTHIKEFIKNFIKDEHLNIMMIDRGNRRFYLKGALHIIAAYFLFNIIYFILKHLF